MEWHHWVIAGIGFVTVGNAVVKLLAAGLRNKRASKNPRLKPGSQG